jgi:hypothetical protein
MGMSKLSEAVSHAAKKETDKRRGSNAWLQEDVAYDRDLRLPDGQKPIVEDLLRNLTGGEYVYKLDQKILDLEILLANLFQKKLRRPVSVSMDRNDWRSSRYNRASYYTVKLISLLQQRKLIQMKKGYHTEAESRRTRIWGTQALLECCPIYPEGVRYDPIELVELRDEKGKLKDYRDTAETYRIRKILQKANEINMAAKIEHDGYAVKTFLRAIFERKFTLYGRLHTRGYRHYQGLDSDDRAEITINGDPVVELDFSGLHPRLLYSAEGIQYDDDPYTAVHDDPRARPFLKTILLAMLNAKDRISAERAANYWLYENKADRLDLEEIGITRARPLIEAFEKAHQPIAQYFCQGKETGLRIMNLDSRIALEVIKIFADAGIPILAVHDSFIVQEQHRSRLYQAMEQAYGHQTGGFRCPIK